MIKHVNIPIFIPHLGCPFQCIYCDQKKIATSNVPDSNEVSRIIQQHLSTISEDTEVEVAFFGGNFTDIEEELQESFLDAVSPFIKSGDVKGIRISTRPDSINEAVLERLQTRQVKTIELGVQSFSDEVLKASARGYLAEDVFESSYLIKKWNFDLGLQLMIGLPGDSLEKDLASTRAAISIAPAMVRIYPTLVISGTVLEHMYEQGRYTPLSLEDAIQTCHEMLLLFEENNIPVIRMGLYPGEDLRSEGVVVAGPFHSAFGERVEQLIFRHQAQMVIEKFEREAGRKSKLQLYVNPRDVSKMMGFKRANVSQIQSDMQIEELQIMTDLSLIRNSIGVGETENGPELCLDREAFIQLRKM